MVWSLPVQQWSYRKLVFYFKVKPVFEFLYLMLLSHTININAYLQASFFINNPFLPLGRFDSGMQADLNL